MPRDLQRRDHRHRQRDPLGEGRRHQLALPGARAARARRRRCGASSSSPTSSTRSPRRCASSAPRYDVVFTSGGVGPTHDDVTMEGIARGLGRPVIRHPDHRGAAARVLQGATSTTRASRWPRCPRAPSSWSTDGSASRPSRCENIYILPGIPELFEQKFEALRERFDGHAVHAARRLHAGGRGHDRRASERHPGRVPGAAARVVSEDRRSRVRREAHARIEGPGLRRAGPGAPACAPAGRRR